MRISKSTEVPPEEIDISEEAIKEFDEKFTRRMQLFSWQKLPCTSVENLRSLGDYPTEDGRSVRRNRIFRSGKLQQLSQEDALVLRSMGINYIVDLRTSYERTTAPDVSIPGCQNIHVPLEERDGPNPSDILSKQFMACTDEEEAACLAARYFESLDMDRMYSSILSDPAFWTKLEEICRILLREDCTGLLFHCTSGKDRTGIIGFFLLRLLGVHEDIAKEDYLASQVPFFLKTLYSILGLYEKNYRPSALQKVVSVFSVDEDRVETTRAALLPQYETILHFADKNLNLTAEDVKRLRDKYLE